MEQTSQPQLLGRYAVRHVGYDLGRQGMQDEEIMPFLHRLRRPTFFTRDLDFYAPSLCYSRTWRTGEPSTGGRG